jgi:multidrug efflux pump subunit AcrB
MVTSIVLTEGLLSLLRRALILLCLSPGLSVAVAVTLPPVLCPEVADAEAEEREKNTSKRRKATKWKLQAILPLLVRL